MNSTDIETVLNTRLKGLALAMPIAWPNVTYSGVKPYAAAQIVNVSDRPDDIRGVYKIGRGKYIVTLVSDPGKGNSPSNIKGELIVAEFAMGTRLTAASGHLVVIKPPEIKDGFRDGADWRVPVIIDFETFN